MKRKFLTVLLTLISALCLCFGLAACGEEKEPEAEKGTDGHTHTAEHFQVDGNGHWKICTECGEKFSVGNHGYNSDNACKTCGYSEVYTKGLNYELDEDTDTYIVAGLGEATGTTDLIIPAYHEGKAVTKIRHSAFYNCGGLTSIKIPGSVTEIGVSAFQDCGRLTGELKIPDSVTSIGNYAFAYCYPLTSIEIPNSVTSIGTRAFLHCVDLTSITIPDNVTSIGSEAFQGTAYYDDASHWDANGVLYIGNHLIEAKKTISGAYTVRQGTKTIAKSAFFGCSGLTSIVIPDSVTSIEDDTFHNCSGLTSIEISGSMTKIGGWTFFDCSELTDIQFKGTIKEWQAIQKDNDWDFYTGDYTVTCTDGTVTKDGTVTYFNAQ